MTIERATSSPSAAGTAARQPFAGIRVVEVGGTLAVAAATKTLSDYGADVVKVEPLAGAAMRRLPPFPGDAPNLEAGAYHLAIDTGKRSLALDLATPSGRDVLARVAAGASLVTSHLDVATREGVDAALAALEVSPSRVRMSEHGIEGPWRDRVENDLTLFAGSTRMWQHAIAGEPPLRYGPNVPTMQWGATAAAVSAAVLWGHAADGERRDVEVAGVEALLGNVDAWFLIFEFTGAEMPRGPGQSKLNFPAGSYRCADGYVTFASSGEPFFSRLCAAIGQPDLPQDPRFATAEAKAQHFDAFFAHLGPWLESRTRDEVFTELQAHGVMVAPILDVAEAIEDRQSQARGSFVTLDQPGLGELTLAGPPFRLDDAFALRPAPRLGQHTVELLDEAGFSRDEQIALLRAGAIGAMGAAP
jgi:crotonobetainyl-CoA:carnitine CoA-transferase CaiB-like acyl-CoA transferase